MLTVQTGDEDHVTQSKAAEQLLNKPRGDFLSPEDFKLNIEIFLSGNLINQIIIMLINNQGSRAAFRVNCMSGGLTSGGGSPPAPAGQSGSIFFLPSQLQKQAGDGSSMVQLLELKSCWTLSGTSGVFQSSSPIVHGASL